jgi:hypothetical protein
MTVTIQIADDLLVEARERAGSENRSLSALIEDVLRRELVRPEPTYPKSTTWIQAFSGDDDDPFLERDFPLPDRSALNAQARDANFDHQ